MASTPRKIYRTGAQHVGRLVPELLHKSQERFGFAYGGMLTQWNAIVGEDLAATTRPECIRWPRRQTGDARIGGTLVIRVDGPSAIEVQHSTPAIVERINAFYGYDAVAGIKIVQGRVTGKRPPLRRRKALTNRTGGGYCCDCVDAATPRLCNASLIGRKTKESTLWTWSTGIRPKRSPPVFRNR